MARDTDTTNILLLLILVVLLVGFGFLTPIFWVIGIFVATILLLIVLGIIFNTIGCGLEVIANTIHNIIAPIYKITDPIVDRLSIFVKSDIGHWLLIGVLAAIFLCLYLLSKEDQVLYALIIPGMLAFFKFISFWDSLSIKRKYNKLKKNGD